MKKEKDEILIIDEDFSCSSECQKYFLNMFGDLSVAYSAGRINKRTYKRNYKSIDANMKANMKFLSNKSKSQLAEGRKELDERLKNKNKAVKVSDLLKNNDVKLLENVNNETKVIEGQIEASK